MRIVGCVIPISQTTVYLVHVLVCKEWIHGKIVDMQGRSKQEAVKALGLKESAIDLLLKVCCTVKLGIFQEMAERALGLCSHKMLLICVRT